MREGVDLKASGPLRDYCLIALRLSNLTSVVEHKEQLTTDTHTEPAIKTATQISVKTGRRQKQGESNDGASDGQGSGAGRERKTRVGYERRGVLDTKSTC